MFIFYVLFEVFVNKSKKGNKIDGEGCCVFIKLWLLYVIYYVKEYGIYEFCIF